MICMTNPSCLAGVICFIYLPVFDLLSVYVYIAIKVELLYYIYIYTYIITIVKEKNTAITNIFEKLFFFSKPVSMCFVNSF